jgi:hypothetical protein
MRLGRSGFQVAALIALASCAGTGKEGLPASPPACAGNPSETWQQPISSLSAGIARDPEGGLVTSTGTDAPTLMKLDDSGAPRWTVPIDGSAGALSLVPGGDILAMANAAGTDAVDPEVRLGGRPRNQCNVTRWDAQGTMLWQSAIAEGTGDLLGRFVSADSAGDVVVAGSFVPDLPPSALPNPPFIAGGFLARLSSSGAKRWERLFVDPGAVRGFVQDLRGRTGIIFELGRATVIDGLMLQPQGPGLSGFVVWFDAEGRADEVFDVTEDPQQSFSGVVRDGEGHLYVTGTILHDVNLVTTEVFVSAFSATGDRLWTRRFSLGNQVDAPSLAVDECGDVLLLANGTVERGSGVLAARMTGDGEIKAQLVVPVSLTDYVASFAPAPGGIFMIGSRDNQQTRLLARLAL